MFLDDATIVVKADTRPVEQQVQQIVGKDYVINIRADGRALGRITGQASEFTKSLDAANARVIAFGASAGAIAIIEKSFHALIESTVEVQKAMNGIQVLLNASNGAMDKFGKSLFDIAKNTGQGFDVVAEAATNLSRQGLGMEETLKRTNDALILSRITGMGAAESVRALTAAVNSFSSQAVTATEIVNKFATVDSSFAIGAQDLPDAISRVGSSAAQAGVSLDELIGLVTAAQVATARGGAVIGNSFKTIFTRLERGKTQTLLESLGVNTKDENGQVRSTIDMLKDLAQVYGTLGSSKQAEVAEKVGGVFQINVLKAALADLGREHSVYASAVEVSNNATDEANKRNERLNQTYAAQFNVLKQNATEFASSAGQEIFGPTISTLLNAGNGVLGLINGADASGIGVKIGKGILDGIGQVIGGPGIVLVGGIIVKLMADLLGYSRTATRELLGLNNAAKAQAAIQESINAIVKEEPKIFTLLNNESISLVEKQKVLLDLYTAQTLRLREQSELRGTLAKNLYNEDGIRIGPDGQHPIATRLPQTKVKTLQEYQAELNATDLKIARLESGISTLSQPELFAARDERGKFRSKDSVLSQYQAERSVLRSNIDTLTPDSPVKQIGGLFGKTVGSWSGIGKAIKGNGSLIGMMAPLLTDSIASFMPKETRSERGSSSVVTAIGNIGAGAGMGAALGGGIPGAIIGGTIAALTNVPTVVNAFTSEMPDLEKSTAMATDDFNKFSAVSKAYLVAQQTYNEALASGTASESTILKAKRAYSDALSKFTASDRQDILAAQLSGGDDAANEVIERKTLQKSDTKESALQNQYAEKRYEDVKSWSLVRSGLANNFSLGVKLFDPFGNNSTNTGRKMANSWFGVGEGTDDSKLEGQEITQRLLRGTHTEDEASDILKKVDMKKLMGIDSFKGLDSFLHKMYGDKNGNVDADTENFIKEKVKTYTATGDLQGSLNDLAATLVSTRKTITENIDAHKQLEEQQRKDIVTITDNNALIDKHIALIQRSNALGEQSIGFKLDSDKLIRDYKTKSFDQTSNNNQAIIEAIIGKGAPQVQRYALNSKLGSIDQRLSDSNQDAISKFISGQLKRGDKEFVSMMNKPQKAGAEGTAEALKLTPTSPWKDIAENSDTSYRDINTIGVQQLNNSKELQNVISSAFLKLDKNGNVDINASLSTINSAIQKIDQSVKDGSGQQISIGTESILAQQELLQTFKTNQDKADNEKREVTAAAAQEKLLQSIDEMKKSFGGISQYAQNGKNPVDDIKPYLAQIATNLKGRDDAIHAVTRGVASAKSLYTSDEDTGRSLLNLQDKLKAFTGGRTIFGGDKLSNAESMMVSGRSQSIMDQLRDLVGAMGAKGVTSDVVEMIRHTIEPYTTKDGKFIDSAKVTDVASFQVAESTGHMTKDQIGKIGQYGTGALAALGIQDKDSREWLKNIGGTLSTGGKDEATVALEYGNRIAIEQKGVLDAIYDVLSGKKNSNDTHAADPVKQAVDTAKHINSNIPVAQELHILGSMKVSEINALSTLSRPQPFSHPESLPAASKSSEQSNNISINSPINIHLNIADSHPDIHAHVQQKLPEFEKGVNELAKQIFAIQGQVDRLAMTNPAGKRIPSFTA